MKKLYRIGAAMLVLGMGSPAIKAQSPQAGNTQAAVVARIVPDYLHFIGRSAALYNGPQYAVYENRLFSGHPYFSFPGFHNGYVVHDNILYTNIPLKFDLVKENVITEVGVIQMIISNDKISRFHILGHTFIKMTKDSSSRISPGFYDELFKSDRLALYQKDSKTIRDDLSAGAGIVNKIVDSTSSFYLRIKNNFLPVNTKAQLLDALEGKDAEIRQFIRRNDFRFRESDRASSLLKTIVYYDSLTK